MRRDLIPNPGKWKKRSKGQNKVLELDVYNRGLSTCPDYFPIRAQSTNAHPLNIGCWIEERVSIG